MRNQKAFYKEVGRRVCQARRCHDPIMTQEALAKRVSLTRTSITNLEKGRQKIPLHTLVDIAAALGVEAATLFPGASREGGERLEAALKHIPASESNWIRSAVANVESERKA